MSMSIIVARRNQAVSEGTAGSRVIPVFQWHILE